MMYSRRCLVPRRSITAIRSCIQHDSLGHFELCREASRPNSTFKNSDNVPFYGLPRESSSNHNHNHNNNHHHHHHHQQQQQRSFRNRLAIAIHSATTAFSDPTRADAVAALGEITGEPALRKIYDKMKQDPTGRVILQERPVVSKATIPYEQIIAEAPPTTDLLLCSDDITFGQAYGYFLKTNGFDPDERDEIRYIDDDDLAYVMLRYRQSHDFWHVLTGLPPTVLGELGIKWLELFQTGLPIAALSSTVGSLRLNSIERRILVDEYLPWAIRTSQNATCFLMNVYYEKEFNTPLKELRDRLQLQPAPCVEDKHG